MTGDDPRHVTRCQARCDKKMITMKLCPTDNSDKSTLKSIDEIVDILDRSFPNFHRTKNINVEVGRALNHLGYQPYKTTACQKYFIEELF